MAGYGLINRVGKFFWDKESVIKAADLSMYDLPTWRPEAGKIQPGDYNTAIKAYRGTIFACVNIRAATVAAVPLRLFVGQPRRSKAFRYTTTREVARKQKEYLFSYAPCEEYLRKANSVDVEEVTDHVALDLLRKVNGFFNKFDLLSLTESFSCLTGNEYWYVPKNKLGVPAAIWPIFDVGAMRVVPDKDKFINGYIYKKGTKEIRFDVDEIVHFKTVAPGSEFYGIGAFVGAADAYQLVEFMNEYEKSMLGNMGTPEGILVSDQNVTEEQNKRYMAMWRSKYAGAKNAGKIALLGSGIKFQPVGVTPRDMAYQDGRRYTREEICAAMGIPVGMLTSESAYRTNADAAHRQLAKYTILPACTRIQEKLNEQFATMYDEWDENLFFAFDNPVPDDEEMRLKQIETHLNTGYSSINEERQLDGIKPSEWGKRPILPMNMMPIGGEEEEDEEEIGELVESVVAKAKAKLEAEYNPPYSHD